MLAAGFHLRDYEIIAHLGSGSFGDVYKAKASPDGSLVALKVCRTHNPEAVVLKQLQHPGIVSVIEDFQCDAGHVTAMHLVDGVSLAELLSVVHRQPRRTLQIGRVLSQLPQPVDTFPLQSADWMKETFVRFGCRIVEEIARALEHAHQKQVFHRDVKPENILVSRDGAAILIDWGVAAGASTNKDVAGGTLNYLTPESLEVIAGFRSAENTDHSAKMRDDIFALGVVFCELVTGELPFPAPPEGTSVILAAREALAHRTGIASAIDKRKDIAPPLRSILTACLCSESDTPASASTRYESVSALADDLRAYRSHQPLRHVAETRSTRAHRIWEANRTIWLALIAMTVIFAGAFLADRSYTARQLAKVNEYKRQILSDGVGNGRLPDKIRASLLHSGFFPDSHRLQAQRTQSAHGLAVAFLNCDVAEPAVELLEHANAWSPDDGDVCNDLGAALFRMEEYGRALGMFDCALQLDCDHAAVLSNRGAAYAAMGDPWTAREDFLKALAIDPRHEAALKHLKLLESVSGEIVQ